MFGLLKILLAPGAVVTAILAFLVGLSIICDGGEELFRFWDGLNERWNRKK